MKILIDDKNRQIALHAQRTIRKMEEVKWGQRYTFDPEPRGIAVQLALTMIRCDDCGESYWSRDQYGSHIGCRGRRRNTGF